MLKSLTVQNYALIDKLHLEFGQGMNILTGETGAGKSVLLGAIGLLLGDRADSSALLDNTKKCIIRGEFIVNKRVREFLSLSELDCDNDLFIQREVSLEGKSRSFVNDTPVNLSLLRELGELLVDIHSQHETLLLHKSDFQLSILDAFAGNQKVLEKYTASFNEYRKLKQQLITLKVEEEKLRTDQDYLLFQFNELNDANPEAGEQASLETERDALAHAEEIKAGIDRFSFTLSGDEENILSALSNASAQVSALSRFMPKIDDAVKRIKGVEIELKDITEELNQLADSVSYNPKRLEILNERLDLLYRLMQKHRVNSDSELVALKDSLEGRLASFTSLEERIAGITASVETMYERVLELAGELSAKRKKTISSFENGIKKSLGELAMPNAVLKIEMNRIPDEEINRNGFDKIQFLFSANKGIPFAEIGKVASGGELSRLMLCLKAAAASLIELPTIIFDEIDTGVSGETAFKIGNMMYELSKVHQLLAITHLPQIASRGEDHFFVYKEVTGKRTYTRVRKLSPDERIVEIARMLSGDKPTAVAMQNARELLSN